jgi:hypothetical protein
MVAGRSTSELSYDTFYASDPKTLVLSCLGAMGNGKSSLLNAICDEQIYRTGRGAEVSIIAKFNAKVEFALLTPPFFFTSIAYHETCRSCPETMGKPPCVSVLPVHRYARHVRFVCARPRKHERMCALLQKSFIRCQRIFVGFQHQ